MNNAILHTLHTKCWLITVPNCKLPKHVCPNLPCSQLSQHFSCHFKTWLTPTPINIRLCTLFNPTDSYHSTSWLHADSNKTQQEEQWLFCLLLIPNDCHWCWVWLDLVGSGWIWLDLVGSGWIWLDWAQLGLADVGFFLAPKFNRSDMILPSVQLHFVSQTVCRV